MFNKERIIKEYLLPLCEAWANSAAISSLYMTFLHKDENDLRNQLQTMVGRSKYFIGMVSKTYLNIMNTITR